MVQEAAGRGRAMHFLVDPPHPAIPDYTLAGSPVKLSDTPGRPRTAPPALGEHTDRVLEALGYDVAARARLRGEGAV